MTSDDSMSSLPRNAWTYLTRTDVTWREATEGSVFFVLSALTGAAVVAGRELVRARTHSSARSSNRSTRRRAWS